MNNSRFRAIPKATNFKIPFKLEEKALLDWLNKLAKQPSREACLLTLRLVQALNMEDMSAKKRLSFLILINEYLKQYLSRLKGECWDACLPLSVEERVYAEATTWNYLVLAKGFFIAAEDSGRTAEETFCSYMALQNMGKAQLYMAAVYTVPDDGFWRFVYQIFTRSEKRKLLDKEINTAELKAVTINTLFKQMLAFQICDSTQFRPRDMRTIFNFLDRCCDHVPIHKDSKGLGELFMLDLATDLPPQLIVGEHVATGTMRYFSSIMIAHNLYSVIKQGNLWHGALKSINNSLFLRVIKTLSLHQKRKFSRLPDTHDVSGVIGFDNIVGYLRKKDAEMEEIRRHLSANQPETDTDTGQPLLNILERANVSINGEEDFSYHPILADGIWANIEKNTQVPESIETKTITIFDSSAKGYLLYWDDNDARTKVGDVLGIISRDNSRLEIAVIRRIAIRGNDCFRFGSEVIGFESEAVYIYKSGHEHEGVWGILIPGIKALKAHDSLMYPVGHFKKGDDLLLHRSSGQTLISVVKELHSSSAISLVELSYPLSI